MDMIVKEPNGEWKRVNPNAALMRRVAMVLALSSVSGIAACAVPAATDGYAANKYGDKARERDKEIRRLERERDDLNFEGVTTQAQIMRRALIEQRLHHLYNKKLGRKR